MSSDESWRMEVADPRAVLGQTAHNLFMGELDEVPERIVVTIKTDGTECVAYFEDGRTRIFYLFAPLKVDVEATQDMPWSIQVDKSPPAGDEPDVE